MKKIVSILVLITIVSYAIAFGSVAKDYGEFTNLSISFNNKSEKFTIDDKVSYSFENIDIIEIETVSADVNIIIDEEVSDVVAHLIGGYTGIQKPYLEVTSKGSTINIKEKRSKDILNTGFGITNKMKLDVYIPQSKINKLNISTVSGDVTGDVLITSETKISTVSGDLDMDIKTEVFEFDSVSGKVNDINVTSAVSKINTTSGNVNLSGDIGELKYNSISGKFTGELGSITGDMKFDTTSGSVKILVSEDVDVSVDFDSVSGRFSSSIPMVYNNEKRNSVKGVAGEGEYLVKMNSISGDLKIN